MCSWRGRLPGQGSNLGLQLQRLTCYRYTTGHLGEAGGRACLPIIYRILAHADYLTGYAAAAFRRVGDVNALDSSAALRVLGIVNDREG